MGSTGYVYGTYLFRIRETYTGKYRIRGIIHTRCIRGTIPESYMNHIFRRIQYLELEMTGEYKRPVAMAIVDSIENHSAPTISSINWYSKILLPDELKDLGRITND